MATRTSNLSRLASQENAIVGKRKIVTRSTSARSVLGDIGNKQKLIQAGKATTKPQLQKSKVSSLLFNHEKGSKKVESPVPMEIVEEDINKLSNAFSSQQLTNVEDIDSGDADNPQLMSVFVNDIYKYLRHLEIQHQVSENFLEGNQVTEKMRKVLVDWLVQVHLRFRLLQETLYLTIDILDRHLQCEDVSKSKLQLVGVTAMFIASKYEEMYAPEVDDFVYITDNAYTSKEILKTEMQMLRNIDFALGKPLPLHFLRRYSKAANVDGLIHSLAKYLMELSLTEYDMAHYKPSELAGAALCLSMKILDGQDCYWTNTLIHYSGYQEKDLLPIVAKLALILKNSEKYKYQAVRSKYSSSKFMKISCLPELKSAVVNEYACKKF